MNLSAQINLFNKVSSQDKMLFTKYLAVMVKSGIFISEAITIIMDQTQNQLFKGILRKVVTDIDNGKSLEVALSKYPSVFDPLYLNLIRVGEESGNLEKNLEYLSEKLKKEYEFRKKVQGAALYPMIILATAVITGGGLSFFVLPKMIDLFKSLDVPLPVTTKILLFIAGIMKNYGIFISIGFIIFIALFRIFIKRPAVKPWWHRFILSLPLAGPLIKDIELTSICRNLGLMLKSGLPVTVALKAECDVVQNAIYKNYIFLLQKSVEKGRSIGEELSSGKFPYMPLIVAKMIGVGEKSGKLDEALLYLGDFFEDEVESTTKNLPSIIEPVLLVAMGLIVAFVALSIISPIYQLTGSIRQ